MAASLPCLRPFGRDGWKAGSVGTVNHSAHMWPLQDGSLRVVGFLHGGSGLQEQVIQEEEQKLHGYLSPQALCSATLLSLTCSPKVSLSLSLSVCTYLFLTLHLCMSLYVSVSISPSPTL